MFYTCLCGGDITKYINKIILGNAYELIKEIPDKSIDLIIIDSPYKLKTSSAKSNHRVVKSKHNLMKELQNKKLDEGIDMSICEEFIRVVKKPNIYIWCNKLQIIKYLNFFVGRYNCAFEIMVWCKTNPMPLYGSNYMVDKEFCLYFRKGVKLNTTYQTGKTYWITPTNIKDKKIFNHPTIKPEWIIDMMVQNSSNKGDVVLDCFVGSGTTVSSAKRLERRIIGIEIDQDYYNIAKNRLKSITRT